MAGRTAAVFLREPAETEVQVHDTISRTMPIRDRIAGFDVARALAVFGMILVNFHSIFSRSGGPKWFAALANILYGRAAALFVMLAGVGIVLMSRRAVFSGDTTKIAKVRHTLFKRSVVLLIAGVFFAKIWKADILHFYAIYLSAGAFLLNVRGRLLWNLALALILTSTLFFCLMSGDPGLGEWVIEPNSLTAIIDNLLFNGFYPVFPWLAFLLIGMWLGKNEILTDSATKRKILIWALTTLITIEFLCCYLAPILFMEIENLEEGGLGLLLISDVFPITPLFSISAVASSVIVIIIAMSLTDSRLFSRFVKPLSCTGKMTLTIYIVHIIFGLGAQKLIAINGSDDFYHLFAITSAFGFCLTSVLASSIWFKYNSRGPLEWLFRRLSSST